ncbi:MAG: FAD-linked oxidase C-terminal domain-containing protein [Planctomycetota bacterium]|jgi:glycolate oxidase|nr:FAD-linked oxidase C-terminal domain-containing protein [Planctomycetota bacterium]
MTWKFALAQIVGEQYLLQSPADLLVYESDALSLFRCKPAAVVLPATQQQVIECVKILAKMQIPFAARGAGTGLSAGAMVPEGGVIIGLNRLDKIVRVEPENRLAVVEPGVVNAKLSQSCKKYNLRYAPDPASQSVCTLGGNVAENAGGPMCFFHGTTTNHLRQVKVVLPDGSVETWGHPGHNEHSLDLRGLFCGSEGSLAIAIELHLNLCPLPQQISTSLISFSTLDAACDCVSSIVSTGIEAVALEVMDQRAINAVEDSIYRSGLPREAGAVLIVELEGDASLLDSQQQLLDSCLNSHKPLEIKTAQNAAEREILWKGRKGAGGALGQLAPDSYVMDGVVPPSQLTTIMRFVNAIADKYKLPCANLFHAGDGNIHPHFAYDGGDAAQAEAVERAGSEILKKCLELGGSITGEHGVGLEKQHLMREQFGDREIQIMKNLSQIFNPMQLLNPNRGLPVGSSCAEAFHRHRQSQ